MLSLINLVNKSDLLLLINGHSIVLYEIQDSSLTAKLTESLLEALETLPEFLKQYKDPKIKIVLDPQKEAHKAITIPDIGSIKAYNRLKSLLLEMNDDILYPITTQKPTKAEQAWEFVVTKANLCNLTKAIIKTLMSEGFAILGIHLLSEENGNLCKKIQNALSQDLKTPKDSYFCMYIQNSNGELHEFTLKNEEIINIKSFSIIEDQNLLSNIQRKFNDNKKRLLLKKVPLSKIYLVGLLPEQLRSTIKSDKNQIFLSARDLAKRLINKTSSDTSTYSTILLNISLIKGMRRSLHLNEVSRIITLKYLHRVVLVPCLIAASILLFITFTILFRASVTKELIENKTAVMTKLDKDYENIELVNKSKKTALNKSANLNELYNIINSNKYSLELLAKISHSNTDKLYIRKFLYLELDTKPKQNIIQLEINTSNTDKQTNNYFDHVDAFIKNLERSFPNKEITTLRTSAHNDNNVPIVIKLAESVKQDESNN